MTMTANEVHDFHIKNILKKLEEKELDAMLAANFNNMAASTCPAAASPNPAARPSPRTSTC